MAGKKAKTEQADQSSAIGFFERYLSLWVGLCMLLGVGIGTWFPGFVQVFRVLDLGRESDCLVGR